MFKAKALIVRLVAFESSTDPTRISVCVITKATDNENERESRPYPSI